MSQKGDKREAILDAMFDLVVERGFHNAPMSLVGEALRRKSGVIYHYSRAKEELIHALYLRVKSVKRQGPVRRLLAEMPPAEAYQQMWMNAYRFYRTHLRETRFLDQYESSPFCSAGASPETTSDDPNRDRFVAAFRSQKEGGLLKDLPPEALQEFSFGVAARLAKKEKALKPAVLKQVAEASWKAIAAE